MRNQTIHFLGKTPYEIANLIGINPATVWRHITGKRSMTVKTAYKYCSLFNISIEQLTNEMFLSAEKYNNASNTKE